MARFEPQALVWALKLRERVWETWVSRLLKGLAEADHPAKSARTVSFGVKVSIS